MRSRRPPMNPIDCVVVDDEFADELDEEPDVVAVEVALPPEDPAVVVVAVLGTATLLQTNEVERTILC